MINKKAIIIGAGFAGMSAAVRLAMNGIKPIVLEARKFPGGRAFSFKDQFSGDEIDNGQHLMMGAYKNFLSLLDLFGTKHHLNFFNGIKIPFMDKSGFKAVFNTGLIPGKIGMLLGLLMLKGVSFQSRINALRFLLRIGFGKNKYTGISALNLLKGMYQSDSMINRFWEPMCLAVMNLTPKQADASVFVEVLRRAFFSGKDDARLIIPKTGLSELFNPFEEFILNNGGEVYYNKPVNAIIFDENEIAGVKIGDEVLTADYYISCLQPFQLLKIIKSETQGTNFNYLSYFDYSPIISIFLWFDKDFIKDSIISLLESNVQWIFNKRIITTQNPVREKIIPGHIAITISGANDLIDKSKEEIVGKCIEDLKSAFPDLKEVKITHSVVIKEKHATIINNYQLSSLRPQSKTTVSNFFLAGDWTDTGLPATIESACLSGFKAAELIISIMKE